ncbi:Flagellar protein FliT [Achromobacter spanius]|nr:Flagellar protein FliT [Achromobacter spanius]SPT37373.1 Flagellar protein FliT [Achromobacter denitrificans]VEE54698.1 Flagellar protein FliT [Achromobacter spanius]
MAQTMPLASLRTPEISMTSLTQSLPAILEHYQEIAFITGEMLTAAKAGDWDLAMVHGQQYCERVELLRQTEQKAPLDEAGRAMKYDLLVRILENDALTRDLAIPQLARLGDLLGRMKRQQTLLSAYGYQAPEE